MRTFTALLGAGLLMVGVSAYANDMATNTSTTASPPPVATTNPVPPLTTGGAPKVATDFATKAGLMQPVFAEQASGASAGGMATYIAPGIPGVIAPFQFYCDSSHCTLTPPATENVETDPLAAH